MQVVLKRDFFAPNGHLYKRTEAAHLGQTTYIPAKFADKLPKDAVIKSREVEYEDPETGEQPDLAPVEAPLNADEQMALSEFAKLNNDHSLDKLTKEAEEQVKANETEQALKRAEFRKRLAERQKAQEPAAASPKKGK